MGSNQSNTSALIGQTSTWVEFNDNWFAQGASRYAYKGTFHGDPHLEGKPCVAKVYKEEWYERLSEHAWKADDRAYRKANEMAQLYNARFNTSKPIEFVKPEFTRVNTRAAFNFLGFIPVERKVKGKLAGTTDSVSNIIPQNATIAVEKYLEGSYVKFNGNAGFLDREDIATPAAFTHFTYHESNGNVLVCDLQGVRSRDGYKFSDPAVNSNNVELGRYGPTDLGKYGIIRFFRSHRCNDLCNKLKKPRITNVSVSDRANLDKIMTALPSERATSHTYQLSLSSGLPNMEVNRLHNNFNLEPIYAEPLQASD